MTLPSDEALDATFTLARKLRDPAFRRFLESNGYQSGQHIVIALPDELTADVFRRMFAQAEPPVILALWRPSEPTGFAFMTAGAETRKDSDNVNVGAGATIGMLYDTLAASSNQFEIPNSWIKVRRAVSA